MSNLRSTLNSGSLTLTWSAPEEPNGVILSYEVTYRVGTGNRVTVNTTDLSTAFTIPLQGAVVTGLSVSAYTRVGRGEASSLADVTTAAPIASMPGMQVWVSLAGQPQSRG